MNFVNRLWQVLSLKFCLVGMKSIALSALLFSTQNVVAATLQDIRYQAIVGDTLQVDFVFDAPISEPEITASTAPSELRLRFNNSQSTLQMDTVPIDSQGLQAIQTRRINADLELILQLERMITYQGRIEGQRYILTLNNNGPTARATGANHLNLIEQIDFERGEQGEGRLILDFATSTVAANLVRVGSNLELMLYNTQIEEDDLYIADVTDFNTLVSGFESTRENANVRIRFSIDGAFAFTSRQEGEQLIIEIKKHGVAEREPKEYQGKTISLTVQDTPVRTVLQIIAQHHNFNLVTTDSVSGNVTLNLVDVPIDQMLDMILKVRGLDKRIEGNILLVAPSSELSLQENSELQAQQQAQGLAPLYSEFIQINYAKASDIAALLDHGSGNENNALISNRGSVSVDERTNTLLVYDTAERLEDIQRLVEVLDIPIKQVVIEARMVTVRDGFDEDLGVRWGYTDQFNGDKGTSGSLEGSGPASVGNGDVTDLDTLTDRLNVNLPADNPAGSLALTIAKLGSGGLLDLELSAMELESNGEIVASPRLTTANQYTAFIEQGTEIAYQEASSSGATSTSFKKAVLSLTVTPQITPDNSVVLDLQVTQDTPTILPTSEVAIDTQKIATQVLAQNGETIVLGGIFQQEQQKTVNKVPLLGDLPLFGVLFRNTKESVEKKELLIFVTPKIVQDEF